MKSPEKARSASAAMDLNTAKHSGNTEGEHPSSEVVELVERQGSYQVQRTVGAQILPPTASKDIFFHVEIKDLAGFVKSITMKCYTESGEGISHLTSYIVKRHPAPASFYVHIRDTPVNCGHSMIRCVLELFDRYGRLQEDHHNHPIKSGSRTWGKELDEGDFFYIAALYVDERWRRLGLGKKCVEKVLEIVQRKFGVQFTYARPGSYNPFSHYRDEDIYRGNPLDCDFQYRLEREKRVVQNRVTATRFWRARGFRRIGNTKYYCFAIDPTHQSRKTSDCADYDPPPKRTEKLDACEIEGRHSKLVCDEKRERKMAAALPIHMALRKSKTIDANGSQNESECLDFLETHLKSHSTEDNDSNWRARDHYGNTIAHVAADLGLPKTLKWILHHLGPDMAKVRNSRGEIAEEIITGRSELARRTFIMMQSFKHCKLMRSGEAKCLFLLQENKVVDFDDIPTIEVARKQMGCTCGECINGFVSPHMRISLLRHAQIAYGTFTSGCEFGVDEILNKFGCSVEQSEQEKATFKNILHTITKCLDAKIAPSIVEVQYFTLGEAGSRDEVLAIRNVVDRALRAVFELAAEGDEMTGKGFSPAFFVQAECCPCWNDV